VLFSDDGELRPWRYIYVYSIESRLIMRVRYDNPRRVAPFEPLAQVLFSRDARFPCNQVITPKKAGYDPQALPVQTGYGPQCKQVMVPKTFRATRL